MAASGSKLFNDPVHGPIEMPELCVRIIDTPQFQRLRNIKQLGGCYFVYPGASHNRFEHSIGTAHLAGWLVESLRAKQTGLEISDEDVLCVKIAGLCHDLGHGPFSHLFEGSFIPRAQKGNDKKKWKHEQASLKMLDFILASIGKHGLGDKDVKFIKELIDGPKQANAGKPWPYEGRDEEKGFLYEIISNKESGIDVDKWDYFARDCHHLGMKNSFDHERIITMARVIKKDGKWHICFRDKQVLDIYEMFHLRANLHRRAYQHKTSNAIEHMITDALVEANDHIRFGGKRMSEAIDDMEAYTKLTDQVYYQILHSSDSPLKGAKDILERIERRDLYRLIGEYTTDKNIPCEDEEKMKIIEKAKATKEVKEQDIILDKVQFDYGMKDGKDPVKKVLFYRKTNEDTALGWKDLGFSHQFSYMLPEKFVEWKIRLYHRKKIEDEKERRSKEDQLQKGFKEWFDEKVGAGAAGDGAGAASDGAGAAGAGAASDGDGAAGDGDGAAGDGAGAASDGAGRKDATPEKSTLAERPGGTTPKKKLEFN